MANDLSRWKSSDGESFVSFAIVVYRDAKALDGPIKILQNSFISDLKKLRTTIKKIKTQTGEPAFQEQMDVGIHTAITKLNWNKDKDTTKWIMVFGDAPPFKEGVKIKAIEGEEIITSGRFYEDKKLATLATENRIAINFILCSSGFASETDQELLDSYQKTLPTTRKFMNEMANATGGAVLDLSDPSVRDKLLLRAAKKLDLQFQQIPRISPTDLEKAKRRARENESLSANVRFAVLTSGGQKKAEEMADDENIQVAREVIENLKKIARVEVEDFEAAQDLVAAEESLSEKVSTLAAELETEFVVHANSSEKAGAKSMEFLLVDQNGDEVAKATSVAKSENEKLKQTGTLLKKLFQDAVANQEGLDARTRQILENSISGTTEASKTYFKPITSNARARRDLLSGLTYLESAMSVGKNDAGFDQKAISQSVRRLNAAVKYESGENPISLSVLASAHYNAAMFGKSVESMGKFKEALTAAYRKRNKAANPSIRKEIEADYALLIQKDVPKAVSMYSEISEGYADNPVNSIRRANWMLAGIYCGDWKVGQSMVDTDKARIHIIRILAFWPDSPEATFYKKALHWDKRKGTMHPHFPQTNAAMMSESKVFE